MFCMACGAQNDDKAQFCEKCGSPLSNGAQPTPATQPAVQPIAQGYSQPAQQVQYGQMQGQVYGQPAVGYGAPVQAVEGCMGAAWKDITSTPGWFKRVLMLCLINIVPILGPFATNGYCLRWARDLSFGKREVLPTKIFRKHEIATGFKAFLIAFMLYAIWCILAIAAIALLSGLLAFINIAAGLVMLVALLIVFGLATCIIIAPAVQACEMRMAITGVLEKGLNVQIVWNSFRRAMGSLIGASLVPLIATGVIRFIISTILSLISTSIVAGSTYNIYNSFFSGTSSAYYSLNALMMGNFQSLLNFVSGMILLMIFFWIISYIIDCLFNLFGAIWSYRAVGHWAARFAPEWALESDEGTLESLHEESLMAKQAYVIAGPADYSQPLK